MPVVVKVLFIVKDQEERSRQAACWQLTDAGLSEEDIRIMMNQVGRFDLEYMRRFPHPLLIW